MNGVLFFTGSCELKFSYKPGSQTEWKAYLTGEGVDAACQESDVTDFVWKTDYSRAGQTMNAILEVCQCYNCNTYYCDIDV